MMSADDRAALASAAEATRGALQKLAGDLVGPLWHGERFSALDAVAAPGLLRAAWLDALYPELKIFDGLDALRAWTEALAERPAVKRSAVPDLHARVIAGIRRYGKVHADLPEPGAAR